MNDDEENGGRRFALTCRRVTSGEQDATPKATSRAKVTADEPLQLVKSAQYTDSQCEQASRCRAVTTAAVCFPGYRSSI